MQTDFRFPRLHIVDHPLVQHKLSLMRDKNTSTRDFRELLKEIAMLRGRQKFRVCEIIGTRPPGASNEHEYENHQAQLS